MVATSAGGVLCAAALELSGAGSRAFETLSRGAVGSLLIDVSAHRGHSTKPRSHCDWNSSSDANQPSNVCSWAQRRLRTFMTALCAAAQPARLHALHAQRRNANSATLNNEYRRWLQVLRACSTALAHIVISQPGSNPNTSTAAPLSDSSTRTSVVVAMGSVSRGSSKYITLTMRK